MRFLIAFLLSSALIAQETGIRRYERKSISYVDVLLITDLALGVKEKEAKYIMSRIRKYIELKRFDYNPIPEWALHNLKRELAKRKRVSLEEFRSLIEKYLLPEIKKVLDAAAEVRAAKLVSESERQSFIATKAKELGVSAEEIEKVLNAAYIYVPALFFYDKKIEETKKGEKYWDCTVGLATIWFHVNYRGKEAKIEYFKTLKTTSFGMASLKEKNLRWHGKRVTPEEFAYYSAVDNACRNLRRALRALRPFKLCAPIIEKIGNSLGFELGKEEGVRIDYRFKIYEERATPKGSKEVCVGFCKVRRVKKNMCYAQKIWGTADYGMMAIEHPRLGIDLVLSTGYYGMKASGRDIEGNGALPFGISFAYDWGMIFNLPLFSELWGSIDFAYGPSLIKYYGEQLNSFLFGLSLYKKFYLGPFAFSGGGSFGLISCGKGDNSATGVGFSSFINPEFVIHPDFIIGLKLLYNFYPEEEIDIYNKIDFSGAGIILYLDYALPSLPFDPWAILQGLGIIPSM